MHPPPHSMAALHTAVPLISFGLGSMWGFQLLLGHYVVVCSQGSCLLLQSVWRTGTSGGGGGCMANSRQLTSAVVHALLLDKQSPA